MTGAARRDEDLSQRNMPVMVYSISPGPWIPLTGVGGGADK